MSRPWSEQIQLERDWHFFHSENTRVLAYLEPALDPGDLARFRAELEAERDAPERLRSFIPRLRAAHDAREKRLAAEDRAGQDATLTAELAADASRLAEAESRRRARVAVVRKLYDKHVPRVTTELDALAPDLARNLRLVPMAAHRDDGADFASRTEAVRDRVTTWTATLRDLTSRLDAAERGEPVDLADLERDVTAFAAIVPDVIEARAALDRSEQDLARTLSPA